MCPHLPDSSWARPTCQPASICSSVSSACLYTAVSRVLMGSGYIMAKLPAWSQMSGPHSDGLRVTWVAKDDEAELCLLLSLTPDFSMSQFHPDIRTVGPSQSGTILRIGKNQARASMASNTYKVSTCQSKHSHIQTGIAETCIVLSH